MRTSDIIREIKTRKLRVRKSPVSRQGRRKRRPSLSLPLPRYYPLQSQRSPVRKRQSRKVHEARMRVVRELRVHDGGGGNAGVADVEAEVGFEEVLAGEAVGGRWGGGGPDAPAAEGVGGGRGGGGIGRSGVGVGVRVRVRVSVGVSIGVGIR